jgi:hypothetical protein
MQRLLSFGLLLQYCRRKKRKIEKVRGLKIFKDVLEGIEKQVILLLVEPKYIILPYFIFWEAREFNKNGNCSLVTNNSNSLRRIELLRSGHRSSTHGRWCYPHMPSYISRVVTGLKPAPHRGSGRSPGILSSKLAHCH